MIDGISQKESEITGIKSSVASLIALLLDADLVNLREVADPLTGGVLFPLFLLILKETAKLKGEDRIAKIFQDSDIEMEKMFPGE